MIKRNSWFHAVFCGTKMIGGSSLGLLLFLASFVKSSEVNYIKTEVYKSSWSPGQTLKIRSWSKLFQHYYLAS